MSRAYPQRDIKLLFGLAAGRCSNADCRTRCILESTESDSEEVIGKIGHIVAHSDTGPRADKSLSAKERDCYDNWILLCPTCHDTVDGQSNTHTVDDLRGMKSEHEQWVRTRLAEEITEVTFAELDVVCKGLLASSTQSSGSFRVIPPEAKLRKNGLTDKSRFPLTMALSMTSEVKAFVEHVATVDSSFPERLKAGFVNEYQSLKEDGIEGDALYHALASVASRDFSNMAEGAAAQAVLAYLFEKCEVFES